MLLLSFICVRITLLLQQNNAYLSVSVINWLNWRLICLVDMNWGMFACSSENQKRIQMKYNSFDVKIELLNNLNGKWMKWIMNSVNSSDKLIYVSDINLNWIVSHIFQYVHIFDNTNSETTLKIWSTNLTQALIRRKYLRRLINVQMDAHWQKIKLLCNQTASSLV